MSSKQEFKDIVKKYIKRDGIDNLMNVLEKTDFYTAPASTRYHDAEEGGLCKHSVEVFKRLSKDFPINLDLTQDDNMERVAIVSLFHDLCKMGFYTVEMRNNKNEKGVWEKVPYYTVDDLFPYGHGEKSVYILSSMIKLTDEEAMAIRWHMGLSVPKEEYETMSKAFNLFPLALHLHIADMKATYLGSEK